MEDFTLPDLSGTTTLNSAGALDGSTAGYTETAAGTTGGDSQSWLSKAWAAITQPAAGSPNQPATSVGTPLTTAATSIAAAYNSLVGIFGGKPTTNNLTNVNTTQRVASPGTNTFIWIGLGLVALLGAYILLKRRR